MTPTLLRTVLFCLLASAALAGTKKPIPKEPDPIEQLTKGRSQYAFPSGASLRFARTKDGSLTLTSGGRELYRLPKNSSAGQALQSPDRRTILLLLIESTPVETPKTSDVTLALVGSSGILRIHSDRKASITCTMHMTEAQLPEKLRHMTITCMDSVLNDGFTLQMQVLRTYEDPDDDPGGATEEIWDLQGHQQLKVYEDYVGAEEAA